MGSVLALSSGPSRHNWPFSTDGPPTRWDTPPAYWDTPPRWERRDGRLPNPGSFRALHRSCKDVFPQQIEGVKMIVNKTLSSFFKVSHTLHLSAVSPSQYRFHVEHLQSDDYGKDTDSPVLIGEMDSSGSLNAHSLLHLSERIRTKAVFQTQQAEFVTWQFETEYRGSDFTAAVTMANPDILRESGDPSQGGMPTTAQANNDSGSSLSPERIVCVGLGGELVYHRGRAEEGGILTLAGQYSGPNWVATLNAGKGGAHASYYHRANKQIQVGVEFEVSTRTQETTASFGYQMDLPEANMVFRGMVNSRCIIGGVLEKRLSPLPATLIMGAFVNHRGDKLQVGLGINVVPLAPPQSIHVDFLDFTGRVRWLPAPGNPRDTSYTAQLKAVEQDNFWHDLRGCDRTVATECPLNIDPLTSNLYAQYFVRVRAERLEAASKWTTPNRTFQPYGDTLLSAPIMDVKVESEGVHVFLTHRQTFLPSLTYVLTLREWSGDLVATVEASSYREFSELSPNHSYCLSASAKHQALVHQTAEKCFDLPPRQDFKTYVGVALGGVLLVALIALIAVTWCCLKDEDHTPIIRDTRQPAKQLLLTPEYVLCEPLKRPLDEEEDEEVEEEVDGACDLYIPRVVASGPNSGPRLNPGNQGTAQGSGLPSPAIPNPPFIQSDYNYVSEDLDWDLHPDTQTPEGSASSTEETQLQQDLHSEGEGNQGRATNSGAPDSGRIVGQGVPVQRGETDSRDGGACSDDEGGRDGSVQDAAPGGPPVPWEAGLEMREEPLVFVRSEYETHWMP